MIFDINAKVALQEDDRTIIIQAIKSVLYTEDIDGDGEISVSVVSSDDIQQLNKEYRGVDATTDVLSFPQYESIEDIKLDDYKMIGDIVINIDKVVSQSIEYQTGRQRELAYLTIHSMYHLLGFDHMQEEEKEEMRSREEMAYRNMEEL